MSMFDKLKQKADELELQKKAEQLTEAAKEAAHHAKEKAGDLAHQNREKVEGVLDKAGRVIDEKTEGKYHDKVAKAQDAARKGVDKIAEQRPGGGKDTPAPPPDEIIPPNLSTGTVDPGPADPSSPPA